MNGSGTETSSKFLDILKHNSGFSDPQRWLRYAEEHNFELVDSAQVRACPGCGAEQNEVFGQYVYYSTCIRLRKCSSCLLIYADQRIDSSIIKQHFEVGYKDQDYFLRQRRAIFKQIVSLVDTCLGKDSKVLDVGGATGELLANLQSKRADLELLLNDLSDEACQQAKQRYGFSTKAGPIAEFPQELAPFDMLLLIDVMYYEADLSGMWSKLTQLVRQRGYVLARLPNKILPMSFAEKLKDLRGVELRSRVEFFNPEHLYVFSTKYLSNAAINHGFEAPLFMPARLLEGSGVKKVIADIWWFIAVGLWWLSAKKLVITPSKLMLMRSK